MILYVNDENEIKDVGTTSETTLKELKINDENNPFATWSVAKICCHKVEVKDGIVTMYTPYVDSRLIEHIDQLGKGNETNASEITHTQIAVTETYEKTLATDTTLTDIQLAMTEMYEMMLGGAQ